MKKENYQYLLRLYSLVDEYLADIPARQENLPEVIVSFCIVTEKIFKIKLHKKNPVLVYENGKIKDDDALVAVIKGRELSMETIKIRETLCRYNLVFDGEFTDDETQVLIDIYNARNHFLHGYKSDDDILVDKENIVKKMGTVWEKISAQAIFTFGKSLIKANKPKNKYSKTELEKVLIDEVRKKIESYKDNVYDGLFHTPTVAAFTAQNNPLFVSSLSEINEKCPRCGAYGFAIGGQSPSPFNISTISICQPGSSSDLYKCNKCNLELTEKEYEIAKKLKNEEK